MPDEIDRQLERDSIFDKIQTDEIRKKAAQIPVGEPGICGICGCVSKRLVDDNCAPCRDKYNLP